MRHGDPVPLYVRTLQTIRARIASGAYPPGSQLPTDGALVQEFGVGGQTVCSAVQELVSAGLI
jgi:DNA-binding GntR family transcriptional regulator